jgi:hypothetical protein
MEKVLDVYKRPYDARFPVICMDETPRQLIKETRKNIPAAKGRPERQDYEYIRCGVCNVFMAVEPLMGKRMVKVTERKCKVDWAKFTKEIEDNYKDAEKITLVMDNYATHKAGSFYETFTPSEAKALMDRFEFVYTPKHGSWLNMAEIELNVMIRQCLAKRISSIVAIKKSLAAWQEYRNNLDAKIIWQFTTDKARIKLHRLYPTVEV